MNIGQGIFSLEVNKPLGLQITVGSESHVSRNEIRSDHASVCCKLASQRPPLLDKVITFRKYKGIDLESFKRELDLSSLCQSTPSVISGEGLDELARDYNSALSVLVDRHAPLKSKRVRSRPSVPWYTAEINAAKKLRRKAERR